MSKVQAPISGKIKRSGWISPDGTTYDIDDSGFHSFWIIENKDWLEKNYGFEISEEEIDKTKKWLDTGYIDHLRDRLIDEKNWIRVSSNTFCTKGVRDNLRKILETISFGYTPRNTTYEIFNTDMSDIKDVRSDDVERMLTMASINYKSKILKRTSAQDSEVLNQLLEYRQGQINKKNAYLAEKKTYDEVTYPEAKAKYDALPGKEERTRDYQYNLITYKKDEQGNTVRKPSERFRSMPDCFVTSPITIEELANPNSFKNNEFFYFIIHDVLGPRATMSQEQRIGGKLRGPGMGGELTHKCDVTFFESFNPPFNTDPAIRAILDAIHKAEPEAFDPESPNSDRLVYAIDPICTRTIRGYYTVADLFSKKITNDFLSCNKCRAKLGMPILSPHERGMLQAPEKAKSKEQAEKRKYDSKIHTILRKVAEMIFDREIGVSGYMIPSHFPELTEEVIAKLLTVYEPTEKNTPGALYKKLQALPDGRAFLDSVKDKYKRISIANFENDKAIVNHPEKQRLVDKASQIYDIAIKDKKLARDMWSHLDPYHVYRLAETVDPASAKEFQELWHKSSHSNYKIKILTASGWSNPFGPELTEELQSNFDGSVYSVALSILSGDQGNKIERMSAAFGLKHLNEFNEFLKSLVDAGKAYKGLPELYDLVDKSMDFAFKGERPIQTPSSPQKLLDIPMHPDVKDIKSSLKLSSRDIK